jgi:hypothetical protein
MDVKGQATQEMKEMLEDLELDFSIGLTSAQKLLDAALDRTEAAAAEEAAALKEAALQEQADALGRAEAAVDAEWDALCVSQRPRLFHLRGTGAEAWTLRKTRRKHGSGGWLLTIDRLYHTPGFTARGCRQAHRAASRGGLCNERLTASDGGRRHTEPRKRRVRQRRGHCCSW